MRPAIPPPAAKVPAIRLERWRAPTERRQVIPSAYMAEPSGLGETVRAEEARIS